MMHFVFVEGFFQKVKCKSFETKVDGYLFELKIYYNKEEVIFKAEQHLLTGISTLKITP